MLKEIYADTGLTANDFIGGSHGYSLDPAYLRYSLKQSLEKMNIATLDVAVLSFPYEVYRGYYGQAKYETMLARSFEFYEYAILKGFLREYGISGNTSFSGEHKVTKDGDDYPI